MITRDDKSFGAKLAAEFSVWVKNESLIDFWSENNAEEKLAEMAAEFLSRHNSLLSE